MQVNHELYEIEQMLAPTAILPTNMLVTAQPGETAITGDFGYASSGEHGLSVSGIEGASFTGHGGTSVSGQAGASFSGGHGLSITGLNGQAASGIGGEIAILWQNPQGCLVYVSGYVGEVGIEAGKLYRIKNGEFKRLMR